jgi:alpha-glucosidase
MSADTRARPAAQLGGAPDWWKGAVIYEVYPRSFQDTDGDGVGDLSGIAERLDYVAALGVDAVWIAPFFTSPMDDFGYDVADYRDVDPLFGRLADFDGLLDEAHRRGLRVLIDLVLSHTSDRHPWFAESRADRTNPRANWYVWADPKPDGTPPNNWLSFFGGPAWEWDGRRRQYYLHNFLASQPDLNFHEPAVQDAVLDVARFWLDRGVDGFRLDTANKYFHDAELRDNPPTAPGMTLSAMSPANPFSMQQPIYNVNRPETLHFHERLRALMDEYPATTAIGEIGVQLTGSRNLADYTAPGRLHMAYSFDLLGPDGTPAHIRQVVEKAEHDGATWTSWSFSNHDVPRVASRFGVPAEATPVLIQLLACLRGTPTLYQGEELGLSNVDVPYDKLQDPYGRRFWPSYRGRDGCRTPMPWRQDARNAGFSTAEPWLPIPEDHRAAAVDGQENDPASPLSRIRAFLAWRRGEPVLYTGGIRFLDAGDAIIAFTRTDETGAGLMCVFNLTDGGATVTLRGSAPPSAHAHGVAGGLAEEGRIRLDPWGAFIGRLEGGNANG